MKLLISDTLLPLEPSWGKGTWGNDTCSDRGTYGVGEVCELSALQSIDESSHSFALT